MPNDARLVVPVDACRATAASTHATSTPTRAGATTAGRLAARYLIHTVGPVCQGGGDGEPALLASCHRRSIEVAAALGCRSIAFPAISTGVYGYPVELAAPVALTATAAALADQATVERVRFVLFSALALAAFEAALAA